MDSNPHYIFYGLWNGREGLTGQQGCGEVRVLVIKAKLSEISSDTHQLHYIPKHHFII